MVIVVIVVVWYLCTFDFYGNSVFLFYLLEDDPGQAENVNLPMLSEKINQE